MMVFDDSFEHEVWNHSDFVRIVLFMNFRQPAPSAGTRTSRSCDCFAAWLSACTLDSGPRWYARPGTARKHRNFLGRRSTGARSS